MNSDELRALDDTERERRNQRVERKHQRHRERLKRNFLKSKIGHIINDSHDWVGKQVLSQSGYGMVGVWARVNENNVIQDV